MLNIDRVIEFLEAENTLTFDMRCWLRKPSSFWDADELDYAHVPVCGTAACIGGTCEILQSINEDGKTFNNSIFTRVWVNPADWISEGLDLKLSVDELNDKLFTPETPGVADWKTPPGEPGHITREHAIAVLRHLRDTGEVKWDLSLPLTPQEIFDRVIDHLVTQGKPARRADADTCFYLTNDGLKCAVGCLLTEEQAREWDSQDEGSSLGSIMNSIHLKHPPAQWMRDSELLLTRLQRLHDDPNCWSHFGGLSLGGKVRARAIAREHNLTLPEALQ